MSVLRYFPPMDRRMKVGASVSFVMTILGWSLPALLASQRIRPTPILLVIGALLYARLWFNATVFVVRAAAGLYNYRIPVLFSMPWDSEPLWLGGTIFYAVVSFWYTVYGFALAYIFASAVGKPSFNVGRLGLLSGMYFSLTTIATVGFGDIVPTSSLARLLVMCEISVGMLYAIFVFSIIASSVKNRHEIK